MNFISEENLENEQVTEYRSAHVRKLAFSELIFKSIT